MAVGLLAIVEFRMFKSERHPSCTTIHRQVGPLLPHHKRFPNLFPHSALLCLSITSAGSYTQPELSHVVPLPRQSAAHPCPTVSPDPTPALSIGTSYLHGYLSGGLVDVLTSIAILVATAPRDPGIKGSRFQCSTSLSF